MITMTDISTLKPNKLWQWFATICSIPHASYHEAALAKHIVDWATAKGIEVYQDKAGNIFLTKPATLGYENKAPIALQAHLDMVTQSNGDFDFLTQPIRPYIDGEWVKADGTTLGADNGIGLASILAVFDSDDLTHPKLEAILTMTEETGMDGAKGLEPKRLTAKLMINTDTEEIGEIYLGCAGGVDADIRLAVGFEPIGNDCVFDYQILGLKGGHSGIDIHKNNANAIKLVACALANLGVKFRLIDIKGGTARNAIPRMASVRFAVNPDKKDHVINTLNQISDNLKTLIGTYETHLAWEIHQSDYQSIVVNTQDSQKIINLINALPNGVVRWSDKVDDTVETSLSLGKIALGEEGIHCTSLIRSLNELGKNTACTLLQSVCDLAGADIAFTGDYIGWNPNPASTITALTQTIYRQVLNAEPALKVIHAGLECGLIQNAYPDMDIVSIGPTIKNAHSPDECVHIGSVATYWQVLTTILANAPDVS